MAANAARAARPIVDGSGTGTNSTSAVRPMLRATNTGITSGFDLNNFGGYVSTVGANGYVADSQWGLSRYPNDDLLVVGRSGRGERGGS